jgi:hypothetical protein
VRAKFRLISVRLSADSAAFDQSQVAAFDLSQADLGLSPAAEVDLSEEVESPMGAVDLL